MAAVMEAKTREQAGTGTARELRRQGMVPANIYGNKQDSEMIALDAKTVTLEAQKLDFFNKLWTINVGGKARKVIAKDVQRHPVNEQLLHVDFMRVNDDSKVIVSIPVRFLNEDQSPALKRQGLLNIVIHHLDIECPANSIPEAIEVDLTGLEMHQSVVLSALKLPKGVRPTHPERDEVVATVVAPGGDA